MRSPAFAHPELGVVATGLRKRLGRVAALDGASLELPREGACALVGTVGSGKTTFVRALLDLVAPDAGSVRVFGLEMAEHGAAVRGLVGYVPQAVAPPWPRLRVAELLRLRRRHQERWDEGYAQALMRRFGLSGERRLGTLPPSELLLVRLVAAWAHRPQLFVWDEPGSALDPVTREQALSLLVEHVADSGATLIVATRSLHAVAHVIDHVGVMQRGRVTIHLPADALRGRVLRYRIPLAGDAALPPEIGERVIRRRASAYGADLVLWGAQEEMIARLAAAGIAPLEVQALTLDEAVLALLVGRPVAP